MKKKILGKATVPATRLCTWVWSGFDHVLKGLRTGGFGVGSVGLGWVWLSLTVLGMDWGGFDSVLKGLGVGWTCLGGVWVGGVDLTVF